MIGLTKNPSRRIINVTWMSKKIGLKFEFQIPHSNIIIIFAADQKWPLKVVFTTFTKTEK